MSMHAGNMRKSKSNKGVCTKSLIMYDNVANLISVSDGMVRAGVDALYYYNLLQVLLLYYENS